MSLIATRTITEERLQNILKKHELWLKGDPQGERADLRRVNLRRADLHGANLQRSNLRGACLHEANLQGADLRGTDLRRSCLQRSDLRGADVDFSCLPLWCGSLGVKTDKRIAAQIAYHFCRLDCDDPDYIAARNAVLDFANKFHRVKECGTLTERGYEK